MVTAHDVAAYILGRQGPLSAMKLQKLVYYAQAWSTVWDDQPLFRQQIEAWTSGPVVRELYELHRDQFQIRAWPCGDPHALDDEQRATVEAVLDYYGHRNAQELSDLTHREGPWRVARRPHGHQGMPVISLASMVAYYGAFLDEGHPTAAGESPGLTTLTTTGATVLPRLP